MKPSITQHHMGAYTVVVNGRKYGVNVQQSGNAWIGFVNGDFVPQTKAPRSEKEALFGVVAHLQSK